MTSSFSADFTGNVVCVSGGATGIGAASAAAFARAGAGVVIIDVATREAEQTVAAITEAGGTARFIRCDVSVEADVEAALRDIRTVEGRLDVVHANAAIESTSRATDATLEHWNRVIGINLTGTFLVCRSALKMMYAAKSGSVLITTSPHAVATVPDAAAYAASKGGTAALVRSLALEAAPYGVRVNALVPGTIDTPMVHRELAAASDQAEQWKRWEQMHPLGRMGRPDEIAAAALFLASDAASFITGAALNVDGGVMAALPSGPAASYNS